MPDLALTVQHPKRAFMRRAIEFEIRLAYHERIFKTLPEQMQEADAYTIPDNGPTPAFEYEDPCRFISELHLENYTNPSPQPIPTTMPLRPFSTCSEDERKPKTSLHISTPFANPSNLQTSSTSTR